VRRIDDLFERYGESHRNAANKAIHWICAAVAGGYALAVAATVFVLARIGQFVGHAIEDRKPSFLEDVQFLLVLVGPAWLLGFVYRRFGIAC
jgi:uncharacterized membrane protein YGL010W